MAKSVGCLFGDAHECQSELNARAVEAFVTSIRVQAVRQLALHHDVRSRAGKDHSRRFRGLVDALRSLPYRELVLDGELARYDENLVSPFEWLRMSPEDDIPTPPMQLGGDDLRPQPLRVRLERLVGVLDRAPALILPVRRLADDGLRAWQEVLERGYEGLVMKDPAATYDCGC